MPDSSISPPPATSYDALARTQLWAVVGGGFAFLLVAPDRLAHADPVNFLRLIVMAGCVALWVRADGLRRRRPVTEAGLMAAFFGSVFSIPVYLVWTRGWRGVGPSVVFLLALAGLVIVTALLHVALAVALG
mgnify:CR=1 FL=1